MYDRSAIMADSGDPMQAVPEGYGSGERESEGRLRLANSVSRSQSPAAKGSFLARDQRVTWASRRRAAPRNVGRGQW